MFDNSTDITKNNDKTNIIEVPAGIDNAAETNKPVIQDNTDIDTDNKYIKDILFVNWYAQELGIIIKPYIKRPPILCKFILITVEQSINIK